jgi:hypothetical protein
VSYSLAACGVVPARLGATTLVTRQYVLSRQLVAEGTVTPL